MRNLSLLFEIDAPARKVSRLVWQKSGRGIPPRPRDMAEAQNTAGPLLFLPKSFPPPRTAEELEHLGKVSAFCNERSTKGRVAE